VHHFNQNCPERTVGPFKAAERLWQVLWRGGGFRTVGRMFADM